MKNRGEIGLVEALLLRGERNAISTAELVAMTGFRNARDLQSEIERERHAGALILSRGGAGGGYFLPAEGPEGRAEIEAYTKTLRSRAISTLRTLRPARLALSECDGQLEVTDRARV